MSEEVRARSSNYIKSQSVMSLVNFEPRWLDGEIQSYQWQTILPVTSIVGASPVEFVINNAGYEFIDLSKLRLYVKCHIERTDGSALTKDDKGTLTNLPLQSFWRQVDVYFQNRLVSTSGMIYPYKAMLDVLLNYGSEAKKTQFQSQLFIKDTHDAIDATDPVGK